MAFPEYYIYPINPIKKWQGEKAGSPPSGSRRTPCDIAAGVWTPWPEPSKHIFVVVAKRELEKVTGPLPLRDEEWYSHNGEACLILGDAVRDFDDLKTSLNNARHWPYWRYKLADALVFARRWRQYITDREKRRKAIAAR